MKRSEGEVREDCLIGREGCRLREGYGRRCRGSTASWEGEAFGRRWETLSKATEQPPRDLPRRPVGRKSEAGCRQEDIQASAVPPPAPRWPLRFPLRKRSDLRYSPTPRFPIVHRSLTCASPATVLATIPDRASAACSARRERDEVEETAGERSRRTRRR